ncbi:MAG: hypothetical protein AAF267_23000 [Deinococcota bacterium]
MLEPHQVETPRALSPLLYLNQDARPCTAFTMPDQATEQET